jgi:hypothetical protein
MKCQLPIRLRGVSCRLVLGNSLIIGFLPLDIISLPFSHLNTNTYEIPQL